MLPKLTDIFPAGFTAALNAKAGDADNRADTAKINGYIVNNWYMSNYPTEDSFNCYYRVESYFDHNGFVKKPCEPYGGLHSDVYLTDLSTDVQWVGDLYNTGPVDGKLSSKLGSPNENYPINFSYFVFWTNTSCLAPQCPLTILKKIGAKNLGDKKTRFVRHNS